MQLLRVSSFRTVEEQPHQQEKRFTVFCLEVRCSVALPAKWTVYRRYRQFKALSQALRDKNYNPPVPDLPSDWMGGLMGGSFAPDFLRQRQVVSQSDTQT